MKNNLFGFLLVLGAFIFLNSIGVLSLVPEGYSLTIKTINPDGTPFVGAVVGLHGSDETWQTDNYGFVTLIKKGTTFYPIVSHEGRVDAVFTLDSAKENDFRSFGYDKELDALNWFRGRGGVVQFIGLPTDSSRTAIIGKQSVEVIGRKDALQVMDEPSQYVVVVVGGSGERLFVYNPKSKLSRNWPYSNKLSVPTVAPSYVLEPSDAKAAGADPFQFFIDWLNQIGAWIKKVLGGK